MARRARRAVRGRGQLEAALVLPAAGRGPARRRAPRVPGGAQRRRHPGCLHAGQDRYPGTGRGGLAELDVHQSLGQARDRQMPLRADAGRERHGVRRWRHDKAGRASLHDDHHGRRGARAVLDGALAADRMAAAESPAGLGDRSLGHLRGRRSEKPRGAAQGLRRHRFLERGVSLHELSGRPGRRRSGARDADQLFRRARLRGERTRERRPRGLGGPDGGGRGIRHHAVRHRDHARAARGEGLHHRRAGHRRLGHAAGPGHGRPGGQDQDCLGKRSLARSDTASRGASSSWAS